MYAIELICSVLQLHCELMSKLCQCGCLMKVKVSVVASLLQGLM